MAATFGNNDLTEEKYLILQLIGPMINGNSYQNADEMVSRTKECKNKIVYNIVDSHMKNKITMTDIKSML